MVLTREEEVAAQLAAEQQQRLIEQQRQHQENEARALEQQRLQLAQHPGVIQPMAPVQPPGFFLPGAEVSRVGMRMPEFTPTDPELWFSIVDRSFQAAGITVDATKFGYALTSIGPRYTTEVRDIIMNPPAERAYETLKAELVKRLSLSQEHKTRRLLEHEEIGDRKPSQFLRHLRGLAGNVVGDQVLRTIWLSRLPAYIQPHLVTRTADTPEQLADIADAIVEATRAPAFQVAETTRYPGPQGQITNDSASIEAKIEVRLAQMRLAMQQEMSEQLTAIRRSIEAISGDFRDDDRRRPRSRSRSRPRSRRDARSGSRDPPASGICWYHWKFGPNARHCRAPCSMQQQENAVAGR
ncbi:PREDICTED: uncharacterized protein LOC105570811 [Vollenhovia emeryi]|uniref:uncharacterized protein LOC105570811 n=1 Tax=Vollenhovia emeryi TaxID=411798 RepID=UPI0005F3B648|nr:PREDICTED: uncharacterized protein LOC105570811 [Vollenhovia emeryi]